MSFIVLFLLSLVVLGGLFVFMVWFAIQILRSQKTPFSWVILGVMTFFISFIAIQFIGFVF